jgi:PadR family transcriptional regulator PadR
MGGLPPRAQARQQHGCDRSTCQVGVSSVPCLHPYVRIVHMADVRVTIAVALVLQEFLAEVGEPRYGYELMQLTGFPSGKLYPILARLQRVGWLSRGREVIDPAQSGRPARYLYRITPDGIEAAQAELSALREQLRPPVRVLPRLRTEGGCA